MKIQNKTLFVNKVAQKQHIHPPSIQEILNMDVNTQEKVNAITFHQSEVVTDKGSHFRGHAVRIDNSTDIKLAYRKLKMNYPESNHIMMAYTLKKYTGNQDNGEFGTSRKLLQLLLNRGYNNTAIFVTRQYGGIHLGQ